MNEEVLGMMRVRQVDRKRVDGRGRRYVKFGRIKVTVQEGRD